MRSALGRFRSIHPRHLDEDAGARRETPTEHFARIGRHFRFQFGWTRVNEDVWRGRAEKHEEAVTRWNGRVVRVSQAASDIPLSIFRYNVLNVRRPQIPGTRERFGNVHLSLGSPLTVHGGVEHLVATIGPKRLLFGTGFPAADPMPAVTMLTYAEIGEADRALIGSGNLERLIGGIAR